MNKVIVVKPQSYKPEPKDCPMCEKAFTHVGDILCFRKYGCCEACDIKYRYSNREKLENAQKPDN